MAFGRCEVVRISRTIDLKDYELRSYNFPLSHYTGSGFILDLPEDVNFVLTAITIFTNAPLLNKPSEGRLDALMWALLRGYTLDIKIQDKKGDIFFPANNLPLDLFISPYADNSVTAAEVFNVVEFLGTPILLSSDNTNVILVKEIFDDIYQEVVVPILPLVPDDVRYQMFVQAKNLLFDRLQLCLNGFYIKNPDVLLVQENLIDVRTNTRRLTYSKEVTPYLFDFCSYDQDSDVGFVTQKFPVDKYSSINIKHTVDDDGINYYTPVSNEVEYNSLLVTGCVSKEAYILDIVLPRWNKDYMIKDLELIFTQIPPCLIAGGRYWAIPAVAANLDYHNNPNLGVGVLSGVSYITKDLYWAVPKDVRNKVQQAVNEYGDSVKVLPYHNATYTKPQPTKTIGAEVEIMSDDERYKFYTPNFLTIVGDDRFGAHNAIDIFVDSKMNFYELRAGYFDRYKASSLSDTNCNSVHYPANAPVYIEESHLINELNNFLDAQNYGQVETFREEFYISRYKMNPAVYPEFGVSFLDVKETSEGFVYVIPAGTMLRFRVKIPLENNFGRGILFLNAFAIEE